MVTSKNRINSYVADEEYNAFASFCSQWKCSHSKGVELLIRQFLLGEGNVNSHVPSNVPDVSTDSLSELRERLDKLEGNVTDNVGYVTSEEMEKTINERMEKLTNQPNPDNLLTHEDVERAIATSLTKLETTKEESESITELRERINKQGALIGEAREKFKHIDYILQSVTAYTEDHTEIRETIGRLLRDTENLSRRLDNYDNWAFSLALKRLGVIEERLGLEPPKEAEKHFKLDRERQQSIHRNEQERIASFEEKTQSIKQEISKDELLTGNPPQDDTLPIEEKIDGLLSELGGQSNNKTDKNTEKGLLGKELALKIGLLRKNGQPGDDTLSKWAKKRQQGIEISVSRKNKPAYAEFLKWEKRGDRWFPISG